MRKRDFITLLGGAALSAPFPLAAQSGPIVIGFLGPETPELFADRLPAFRQALSEAGFVEGRNLSILYRWAEGQSGRLPQLAAELFDHRVEVIVAPGSTPAVFAAKAATTPEPKG